MVPYPEAAATLGALARRRADASACAPTGAGSSMPTWTKWVCSALVDSSVTSARAGARKPHPNIYRTSVESLGVVGERRRVRRRFVGARRAWAASPGDDRGARVARGRASGLRRPRARRRGTAVSATSPRCSRSSDSARASDRRSAVFGQAGRPAARGPRRREARSGARSCRGAATTPVRRETQASSRRPTLVTLPVAVWGRSPTPGHSGGSTWGRGRVGPRARRRTPRDRRWRPGPSRRRP